METERRREATGVVFNSCTQAPSAVVTGSNSRCLAMEQTDYSPAEQKGAFVAVLSAQGSLCSMALPPSDGVDRGV